MGGGVSHRRDNDYRLESLFPIRDRIIAWYVGEDTQVYTHDPPGRMSDARCLTIWKYVKRHAVHPRFAYEQQDLLSYLKSKGVLHDEIVHTMLVCLPQPLQMQGKSDAASAATFTDVDVETLRCVVSRAFDHQDPDDKGLRHLHKLTRARASRLLTFPWQSRTLYRVQQIVITRDATYTFNDEKGKRLLYDVPIWKQVGQEPFAHCFPDFMTLLLVNPRSVTNGSSEKGESPNTVRMMLQKKRMETYTLRDFDQENSQQHKMKLDLIQLHYHLQT